MTYQPRWTIEDGSAGGRSCPAGSTTVSDQDSPRTDEEPTNRSPKPLAADGSVLPDGGQSAKVVGQLADSDGIGVLGHNTADSGETYGVVGEVDSPEGYGLYTPDDARVDGNAVFSGPLSGEEDWIVIAEGDGGEEAADVVHGHSSNGVAYGAVGGTIAGGGPADD